ncbi:MAG: thiolase family protein [Gammaproteobacteria bacterium]|nr:thiolase family protein [Gammaproteobacteria bacterium]
MGERVASTWTGVVVTARAIPPVAIVGIGETPPVRRSDKDVRTLVIDACLAALEDAGIEPEEVDGVVSDSLIMPASVPRDYLAAQLGMSPTFEATQSLGGAGIVCGPNQAAAAIASGHASVVLCYFGVDWGTRASGPYGFHDIYPAKLAFEKPYGFNAQPVYFALWARRYMREYGLTPKQLASIAIDQRNHALLNGNGQTKKPLDFETYEASRIIADPLRQADCCLITDGAGAYVMTSMERARDCRHRPITVLGTGFGSAPFTGDSVFTQNPDQLVLPGARQATEHAFAEAGITHNDVDFLELYDCFSISCLMQIEDMGFCAKGDVGAFVEEGNVRLGGKLPVNTHGGLMSYSYRLGIEHVTEAVRQLRGDSGDAQVADAEIGVISGLSIPDFGVMVLGR